MLYLTVYFRPDHHLNDKESRQQIKRGNYCICSTPTKHEHKTVLDEVLPAHAVLSYQLGICPPELKHLPRKGHKGKPDPVPINTFIHQSDGADISVAAVVLTLLSYSVCFVLLQDTAVQHMSCLHRLSSPHSPSCNNKTSLGCLER